MSNKKKSILALAGELVNISGNIETIICEHTLTKNFKKSELEVELKKLTDICSKINLRVNDVLIEIQQILKNAFDSLDAMEKFLRK